MGAMIVIIGALVVVIMVMGGALIHQHKVLDWVDEREKQLVPVMQCVASIHFGGASRHSVGEIDGITRSVLVEVAVDPDNLPEGENWHVAGDKVFVQKVTKVPSTGGMRQLELLEEMEGARRALVEELRKQFQKLVAWEQTHPVPGEEPPTPAPAVGVGLKKIGVA